MVRDDNKEYFASCINHLIESSYRLCQQVITTSILIHIISQYKWGGQKFSKNIADTSKLNISQEKNNI